MHIFETDTICLLAMVVPAEVLRKLAGEHSAIAAVHLLRDVLQ